MHATPGVRDDRVMTDDSKQPPSTRATVRRLAERGHYDRTSIDAILDEALICHVGITTDDGPVVIPTIHARIGDSLYVHGSPAGRLWRTLGTGVEVCVTVTLVDGLVLARSAFHHSMNYRSVVIFGRAEPVSDLVERDRVLSAFVEHVVPGRAADLRASSERELRATAVLRIGLDEASVKMRTGGPSDDAEDLDEPAWAGVLPLTITPGSAIEDDTAGTGKPVPEYLRAYRR